MAQVMYNVWLDKPWFDDAERLYQEHLQMLRAGGCSTGGACVSAHQTTPVKSSLVCEIARAREHIQKSLCGSDTGAAEQSLLSRIDAVEKENKELRKVVDELRSSVVSLTGRVSTLEKGCSLPSSGPTTQPAASASSVATKTEAEANEDDDEEDFELFGSDDEERDEDAERIRQERLKAYEAKQAKKPAAIAKSNIILDVKPWDDETDMAKLEECVRSIEMDGLLWGVSKLVPLAYGIKKLQISCVVEDEKVSTDDLEEQIVAFEDYIQSMDIAAFNKI